MSGAWVAQLKRWPGWLLLVVVVGVCLAVGVSRDSGPRTSEERIEALERRLACPVCDGESVYESQNAASIQIKEAIRQAVEEGQLSDQQILDRVVANIPSEPLLVPTASGIDALAWALPAAALVIGVAGLAVAFRRWQASARRLGHATDADYELVERAMAERAGVARAGGESPADDGPLGDESR